MKTRTFRRTEKPDALFSKVVYAEKVAEGLSERDAVVLAGYTGVAPESYVRKIKNDLVVRKTIADILESKARLALRKMSKEKAEDSSFAQLASAAATLIDKARLEKGLSTSHAVHVSVDLSKLSKDELRRYLEEKSRAYTADRK